MSLAADQSRRQAHANCIAESALAENNDGGAFQRWHEDAVRSSPMEVERVPLDDLDKWRPLAGNGDIVHTSGGFFGVRGLSVSGSVGPTHTWDQPIIDQAETGILGMLTADFDGVLHFLVQAKIEPGNVNGVQIAPTVQATRSNHTGVHRGRAVPFVEYFQKVSPENVLADSRQSEQGSWFLRKRNRNTVVRTTESLEVPDHFHWMTLGRLHSLLSVPDLVSMDARTVLSCLPMVSPDLPEPVNGRSDGFGAALRRSLSPEAPTVESLSGVLGRMTRARSLIDSSAVPIPLRSVRGWNRTGERLTHESGRYFDIIGVRVTAGTREVSGWDQPMLEPRATGLAAFLTRRVNGVLHVLAHVRAEPGFVDGVELGPTVQCTPENYDLLPEGYLPAHLDKVEKATPEQIRFDTILSEEGGRLYHARTRYVIIETDIGLGGEEPDHVWLSLGQLSELLRHSHYVNIQARTLVACLHSLLGAV